MNPILATKTRVLHAIFRLWLAITSSKTNRNSFLYVFFILTNSKVQYITLSQFVLATRGIIQNLVRPGRFPYIVTPHV